MNDSSQACAVSWFSLGSEAQPHPILLQTFNSVTYIRRLQSMASPAMGWKRGNTAHGWLATGRTQGFYFNQFIIKQGRVYCWALRARDMVQITSLWFCVILWLPGLPKSNVVSVLWKKPCSCPKLCQGWCWKWRVTVSQTCTWGTGISSLSTG